MHSKIIRDADKLDNFRVKKEEKIENIFPGIVKNIKMMEKSKISEKVYQCIIEHKCVNIRDRKYPIDYWVCILAFVFDFNFKETYIIIKENNYIDVLIDKFNYYDLGTYEKMEEIRNILNNYIEDNI